jgi:hypothetical protein
MSENKFSQTVEQMRAMADLLIPYTHPRVDFNIEKDVLILKQRTITVDGYEVHVCFSKADFGEYVLESLQVQSAFAPFLPFTVVCKVGRAFLGSNGLSYIEFLRNNRKVYCWTIKSREGRPLPLGKKTRPGSYEGFEFNILLPGSVDLL